MGGRRLAGQLLSRLAVWAGVLVISGLLAATLVRLAPGFGMDERFLDARLSAGAREAIAGERAGDGNVLRYYAGYLARVARGDLGTSLSLNRPVGELLAERTMVSVRSGAAGLLWAWLAGLLSVAALEWRASRAAEGLAAAAAGALLCVPAALAALACVYAGAGPQIAIAAILFPRIFRYTRSLAAEAGRAPHVVAAHALGIRRWRLVGIHVAAPILPELVALAGVSVSMAVGATIPVEALCDSPGVGRLVWQAALARDVPVLVNVTLLITALTTGANLLADAARSAREAA